MLLSASCNTRFRPCTKREREREREREKERERERERESDREGGGGAEKGTHNTETKVTYKYIIL
jgi:hypothetical protein